MTPVTFLFTDIEGSTQLWEERANEMAVALREHDARVRAAIEGEGGAIFKTVGDAFCAAFGGTDAASRAAAAIQRAMAAPGLAVPLKVRIALHRGEAESRDGDYFGPTLNRVARLLGAARGGQTLLSSSATEVDRALEIVPLGEHRLRDLAGRERIAMLVGSGLPDEFPPLRTLDAVPNNLGADLSALIGRTVERRALRAALTKGRWATLVGAGGVGKSRLASTVAADLLEAEGSWTVDLASTPAGDIEERILEAVGGSLGTGESTDAALRRWADRRRVLVVLDNCEAVLAETARVTRILLRVGAGVRVLTTSREPLGDPEERVVRLEPLPLPVVGEDPMESDAVRMFLERAEAGGRSVSGAEEIAAVAEICRRLDGIPLALELAAARTRTMSAGELLPRLARALKSPGPQRRSSERHSTLAATIEWSIGLLSASEARLLARLAVFPGGFTLDAAEIVGSDETFGIDGWEAGEGLSSLVGRSLATAQTLAGGTRYRIYETVRTHVREADPRLAEDAFVAWAIAEAERARQDGDVGRRLDGEFVNFRAALRIANDLPNAEAGFRLAISLHRTLLNRWNPDEVFAVWRALVARVGEVSDELAAPALAHASWNAGRVGEWELSRMWGEAGVEAGRRSGIVMDLARAINALGTRHDALMEYPAAEAAYRQGLSLDALASAAVIVFRMNLSLALQGQERFEEARTEIDAARAIAERENDGLDLPVLTLQSGTLRLDAGDLESAVRELKQAGELLEAKALTWRLAGLLVEDLPTALVELDRREEAVEALERGLALARLGGMMFDCALGTERLAALARQPLGAVALPRRLTLAEEESYLLARAERLTAEGEGAETRATLARLAGLRDGARPTGAKARRLARLSAASLLL